MAVTGVDANLTLRAKFARIAITSHAINKLRDGDKKCHDEYMAIANRIRNLVYALDSEALTDAITDEQIYCLNAALFNILKDNQNVPGMVPSTVISDSGSGIGAWVISKGYGNIFQIQ